MLKNLSFRSTRVDGRLFWSIRPVSQRLYRRRTSAVNYVCNRPALEIERASGALPSHVDSRSARLQLKPALTLTAGSR